MDFGLRRYGCLFTLCAFLLAAESSVAKATPPEESLASGTPAVAAPDGAIASPSADLSARVRQSGVSMNILWMLVAGALVMFMQVGFSMVETGLCRAKNAADTISMNLMVFAFACLAFWSYGFALGWGNLAHGTTASGWQLALGPGVGDLDRGGGFSRVVESGQANLVGGFKYGLIGLKGFFLNGQDDPGVMALFFFTMVLMATTASIPVGAMAERWRWRNFCLYGLWAALPFSIFANWVWGGGWLAQSGLNWGLGHGAVDFAGSGVVHALGGLTALAGAWVLGPRIGKYRNGKPQPIPGHHVPMVLLGTLILAFGWLGFNPGSAVAGSDFRTSAIVVNTVLAGVAGAVASMLTLFAQGTKPDPTILCNGLLAGLVSIAAPCAFVESGAAVVIGAAAGVLAVHSVFLWEKIGVDDPVGAISVHGLSGVWGLIAVGLFANGKHGEGWNCVAGGVRGLLYGDAKQLLAQLLAAAVLIVLGLVMAFGWFRLSNRLTPMRVTRETELEGLDLPEMGTMGYPDFTVVKRG
ncbi:MAG: ammonium transporter [Thermoguttaceae bacterium]